MVFRKLHPRKLTPHSWALILKTFAIAGALVVIFMLFKINANSNQLAQQAKAIAEQNQRIAKANGAHIDCIADLFARYTRERTAITIDDLDKCQVTEDQVNALFGAGSISGAVDFTMPNNSAGPQTPSQATPQQTMQPNQPTPQTPDEPQPGAVRQFLDKLHDVTEPVPILNKVL